LVSELTDKIRSKGYWDVDIRPRTFEEQRVDYEGLEGVLEPIAVSLRGWPVPYIDRRTRLLRGDDWVGQDVDAELVSHYEAWRFFTSGQFNQIRAVSADWRTDVQRTFVPQGFTSVIEVWEILFYLTEVFELAARLSLSPAGDEDMTIAVRLEGLGRRALVVGQPNRVPFDAPYGPPPPALAREASVSRQELAADTQGGAVEMAREFFLRFGWKPSHDQLAQWQQELIGK
jgi:hypothetical protein